MLHLTKETLLAADDSSLRSAMRPGDPAFFLGTCPVVPASHHTKLSGISIQLILAILHYCANIQALNISINISFCGSEDYHGRVTDDSDQYANGTRIVANSMHLAISRLDHLEELKWTSTDHTPVSDADLAGIVNKRTNLKSFTACHVMPSPKIPQLAVLGLELSHFTHLTHLCLRDVRSFDVSWCEYSWTSPLNEIYISSCNQTPNRVVHQFIQNFASTLTKLTLIHRAYGRVDKTIYDYDLPSLTTLGIGDCSILRFQKCESLAHITGWQPKADEWKNFRKLVCALTWPQLHCLQFPNDQYDYYSRDDEDSAMALGDYCEESDIWFTMGDDEGCSEQWSEVSSLDSDEGSDESSHQGGDEDDSSKLPNNLTDI